jgi:hypothetical protein
VIEHKLYDGDVTMMFDPIKHMYTANGVHVPSVTGVTGVVDKPALIHWAVNETLGHIKHVWKPGKEYTKDQIKAIIYDAKEARFRTSGRALNIGTDAHDWIERYIKSRILDLPTPESPDYPPVLNSVNAYLEWEESAGDIEYIASERKVYSQKYMYSGTVDIYMKINDELVVADLKTSKGIYPEYHVQCAAYANAISEEDDVSIDKISVVRVPKDGNSVEIEERRDVDYLFGIFRACLVIWRWKNNWQVQE